MDDVARGLANQRAGGKRKTNERDQRIAPIKWNQHVANRNGTVGMYNMDWKTAVSTNTDAAISRKAESSSEGNSGDAAPEAKPDPKPDEKSEVKPEAPKPVPPNGQKK